MNIEGDLAEAIRRLCEVCLRQVQVLLPDYFRASVCLRTRLEPGANAQHNACPEGRSRVQGMSPQNSRIVQSYGSMKQLQRNEKHSK